MKRAVLKNLSPEIHGIIWAVAIHLIIGQLVVFTSPIKNIPERPVLVFWGAFLGSLDPSVHSGEIPDQPTAAIIPLSYATTPTDNHRLAKPKTDYRPHMAVQKKTSLKTTFFDDDRSTSAYTHHSQRQYQDTKVEYQPLRFNPYLP